MKRLTEAFNSVTVGKNEIFQIELDGNASAGYQWMIEGIDDKAQFLGENTITPQPMTFGGSIKQVFTFKALKEGDIDIIAAYKAIWQPEPAETCIFHINVR